MGDPSGLFGLSSAAAAEAPSGDPSAGVGVDPSFGMSATPSWNPSGMGADRGFGQFTGQIPGDPTGSTAAQRSIQGDMQGTGPPPTDQPFPASTRAGQPAAPQQRYDIGMALAGGPSTHPELSGTPGNRYASLGDTASDASVNEAWAPAPNTRQAANMPVPTPASSNVPIPQPRPAAADYAPSQTNVDTGGTNLGDLTNAPNRPSLGTPAPDLVTGAPPTATPGATAGGSTSEAPGQQWQGGRSGSMQSPLEQLASQLLHMLLGGRGGMGGLEQMLMRGLLNPQQIFPQYYGGGFNQRAGPGYYPPGTIGGRNIPPGGPRAPAQAGATPAPGGGWPAPGNPPLALPPRRLEDTSLPGPPYTGAAEGQPPPWYRPQGAPLQGGQAGGSTLPQDAIHVPQGIRSPPGRPTMPSVDRSSLAQEASDPAIARRLAWMVNGEVGRNAPDHVKQVQLETVFNRALVDRTSLAHALAVHQGRSSTGYYASATYSREAMPTDTEMQKFQSILRPVLAGSNLSDQGYGPMTGNASGSVARHQFYGTPLSHPQQGYMLGGESYFQERARTINRLHPVQDGM